MPFLRRNAPDGSTGIASDVRANESETRAVYEQRKEDLLNHTTSAERFVRVFEPEGRQWEMQCNKNELWLEDKLHGTKCPFYWSTCEAVHLIRRFRLFGRPQGKKYVGDL